MSAISPDGAVLQIGICRDVWNLDRRGRRPRRPVIYPKNHLMDMGYSRGAEDVAPYTEYNKPFDKSKFEHRLNSYNAIC